MPAQAPSGRDRWPGGGRRRSPGRGMGRAAAGGWAGRNLSNLLTCQTPALPRPGPSHTERMECHSGRVLPKGSRQVLGGNPRPRFTVRATRGSWPRIESRIRGNSHVRFGAGDEETCLSNGARRFIPTLPADLSLSNAAAPRPPFPKRALMRRIRPKRWQRLWWSHGFSGKSRLAR